MTLVFNPQLENSSLDDIRDAIDSTGQPGALEIYDGATLVSTLPLSLPSFADAAGGTASANPIGFGDVLTDATPDNFRFVTSRGDAVFSGDIPADLALNPAWAQAGQTIGQVAFSLTEGVPQARDFASTVSYPYQEPDGGGGDVWGPNLRYYNTGDSGSFSGIAGIAADDTGVVIVITNSGYASKSEDFGTNFTQLTRGLNSGNTSQGQFVLTNGEGTFVACFFGGNNSISRDKGDTWTRLPDNLNAGGGVQFYGDAVGDIWVFCGSGGYASRTTDNCETFSPLPRKLNNGNPAGPIIAADIPRIAMSKTGVAMSSDFNGYMSRSEDFAATWSTYQRGILPGEVQEFASLDTDDNGVWVAMNRAGAVFRSDDDALTFIKLGQFTASSGVFVRYGGADVWIIGGENGRTYRSEDNGITFTALVQGLNSGGGSQGIRVMANDMAQKWYTGHADGWAAISPPLAP